MKARKKEQRQAARVQEASAASIEWLYPAMALAALVLAFIAYTPSMHAPFLFDDLALPFAVPNPNPNFRIWMGIRPALMASYWMNFRAGVEDTYGFHATNVVIHVFGSIVIFLVVQRLLEMAGPSAAARDGTAAVGKNTCRDLLAAIAAAIFLLHPIQAECVAYVAGRSETLSVLFLMGAYAVAVCRREEAIGWLRTGAVLALFAAALMSKEHTVALVPLLVLTDFWWSGFSVRAISRNWRLYLPMLVCAGLGVAFFWNLITRESTAGFAVKDFTWYQYLFTQFRALLVYVWEFAVPVTLNLDPDFPISKTILDHGAWIGLIVLLAITAAAWHYRRRYPLAGFGWFAYLLLMAPTSSIMPIRDPIAERRIYLSMLGLLLIVLEGLRQSKMDRRVLAVVLAGVAVVGTAMTWSRSAVWANPVALWQDTVAKSPNKFRPRFQLASAYYGEGRCDAAATEFAAAAKMEKPRYDLLVDWALALDCLQRYDEAMARLREAAKLEPTAHVYSQIGMVYAKQARWAEAMEALNAAEKLDPRFAVTYIYKGGVHLSTNQPAQAEKDYLRALELNDKNPQALQGLDMARQRLASLRK